MNRWRRDYATGVRLVAARGRREGPNRSATYDAMRVETVTFVDHEAVDRGDNARMILRSDEGDREVRLGSSAIHEEGAWRVVWTDPIPEGDADAIRIVSDIHGTTTGYHQAMLLWIAMREDDVCYAHQIWDHDEASHENGAPQAIGPFRFSAAPMRMRAMGEVGPGDVVVCLHDGATLEDNLYEHRVRTPRMLVYARTPADIPSALPWHRHESSPTRLGHGDLAGPHVVEEAEDLAWARTRPSEALVVAWEERTPSGRTDIGLAIMESSGVAFHNNDDPGPYLEQSIPGPGLWKFENASMHGWRSYEGEYDAEMAGDWRPATIDDAIASFGDLRNAGREIVQHLDGSSVELDEESAAEVMIALANASAREVEAA